MTDSLRAIIALSLHKAHATTPWPAEDCGTCEKLADAALAAIEASGTHVVVPVEPTEEMQRAGDHHSDEPVSWIYRAMIADRPRDAASPDPEPGDG